MDGKYIATHTYPLTGESAGADSVRNDFHFYGELQVTNIVQMAVGLVIDLRLDKIAGSFLGGPKTLLGDAWTSMGKQCTKGKVYQTPADKRAVLGVYHITNM